jgi:N-acetylated-alpha-linked acidic dipeptidase
MAVNSRMFLGAAAALLVLPIGLHACQHERTFHNQNVKRAVTPRAALSPDEQLIVASFDNNSLNDWSYYYTHGDHLAGVNKTMAQWTADRWAEAGIQSRLDSYHVFLNYPVSKSLVVTYPNGTTYTPSLEEAVLIEDDTSSYPNRIPTFHGNSASGTADAEFVYVGRGQQVDFDRLKALGVQLEGKIAVSRYMELEVSRKAQADQIIVDMVVLSVASK